MRSWYRIAIDLRKVAQIWEYRPDEEDVNEWDDERNFASKIKEFHEMEFKFSMMRELPFQGHPKRQENIQRQLEQSLIEIAEELQKKLLETLEKWLDSHAILTPNTWASKRVQGERDYQEVNGEGDSESMVNNLLWEYDKYVHNDRQRLNSGFGSSPDYSTHMYEILSTALNDKESYPSLIRYVENAFLPDYKNSEIDSAQYNLEDFNLSHDQEFETIEEAEAWIEDYYTVENVDLEPDVLFGGDVESFVQSLQNWGSLDGILTEFYQHLVFPSWYDHWSAQGIDETRETVEDIHTRLKAASSKDLGNLTAMISMGFNVAHQTGDMVEYLEQDVGEDGLKSTLDAIDQGAYVEKAKEDLKSVGVQI